MSFPDSPTRSLGTRLAPPDIDILLLVFVDMAAVVAGTATTGAAPPPPDPIYTLRPHAGEVTALGYVNLGSRGGLISGTASGQLGLWDLDTKRQTWVETCSSPLIAVDGTAIPGRLVRVTEYRHEFNLTCEWHKTALLDRTSLCEDKHGLDYVELAFRSQCRGNVVEIWSLKEGRKEGSFSIESPAFCRLSILGRAALAEGSYTIYGYTPSTLSAASFAVSDSKYGKVNLYDAMTRKLLSTLSVKEPKSKGMCMCVKTLCGPEGVVYVLGGFEDGSVAMWDCRNNHEELASLKLFSEPVMCLAYDSARSCGVCGSPLNTLESFSISTSLGQLCKEFSVELKNAGVSDVDVRQDNKIMASGGWDGRIRVFGCKKGKPLAVLNYHTSTVNCVSFVGPDSLLEDRNLLACGSKDERISLWKLY